MRRYAGLIVFGGVAAVAAIVYVTLVLPVRGDIARLVEGILEDQEVSAAELENRLDNTPSRDDEELLDLREELERDLPAAVRPWTLLGRESAPDTNAFKGFFETWHTRMVREEILDPRAWPRTPWRTGPALPSTADRESTARIMILVEGLGRGLRDHAGTRILRLTPVGTSGEAEFLFEFDPEDWGRVLAVLLAPTLEGETFSITFEIRELTVDVPETGPAGARVRVALAEAE